MFSQRDEGQDEVVLHFDFVQKDVPAASMDVAVEKERARDGAEQEHVQEDEEEEECLKPLRYLE